MSKLMALAGIRGYSLDGAPAGNVEGLATAGNVEGLATATPQKKKKGKECEPTGADHAEARGLAMAAAILGRSTGQHLGGLEHGAAYAHAEGLVLAPSQKDPSVRRWVREQAQKHLDAHPEGGGGLFKAIADRLHLTREKRKPDPAHPTHHEYWKRKHGWLLKKAAGEHNLDEETIAHALAYLAHTTAEGRDEKSHAASTIGKFLAASNQQKRRERLGNLADVDRQTLKKLKAHGDAHQILQHVPEKHAPEAAKRLAEALGKRSYADSHPDRIRSTLDEAKRKFASGSRWLHTSFEHDHRTGATHISLTSPHKDVVHQAAEHISKSLEMPRSEYREGTGIHRISLTSSGKPIPARRFFR